MQEFLFIQAAVQYFNQNELSEQHLSFQISANEICKVGLEQKKHMKGMNNKGNSLYLCGIHG